MISGYPQAFISNQHGRICRTFVSEQGGRRGISAEVEKCVKNFYERCDNSREAPGKQDTIKVTIDGSKITCQKKTFVHN